MSERGIISRDDKGNFSLAGKNVENPSLRQSFSEEIVNEAKTGKINLDELLRFFDE